MHEVVEKKNGGVQTGIGLLYVTACHMCSVWDFNRFKRSYTQPFLSGIDAVSFNYMQKMQFFVSLNIHDRVKMYYLNYGRFLSKFRSRCYMLYLDSIFVPLLLSWFLCNYFIITKCFFHLQCIVLMRHAILNGCFIGHFCMFYAFFH